MRLNRRHWIAWATVLLMIAAACGDGDADTTTTAATPGGDVDMTGADIALFGNPAGAEGESIQGLFDAYNEAMGSSVRYDGSDDFETQLRIRVDGGDPPQVAIVPQPAQVCEFADAGHLESLEDMGFDIGQLESDAGKFSMDLGLCDDGMHYGIPWFAGFKSLIWYHQPTFADQGYEIPETYDDLVDLSAQIVADGMTPWCIGWGSDAATGWPGTDFIEDIVARQHGPDVYAQWMTHEIPSNDPQIVESFNTFGEILHGEGFVLGGADGVGAITFQEAANPLFNDPPGCLMHKQADFVTGFFPEGGTDIVTFFPFPSINGNQAALGSGDTIIVFDATPQVVQAVTDWISPEWSCAGASASGGTASQHGGHGIDGFERLFANKSVPLDCYETDLKKDLAQRLQAALDADIYVYDASDVMPTEVGFGTFFPGMVDFSRGSSAEDVTGDMEAAWPSS